MKPSRASNAIALPFESQDQYRQIVKDRFAFRSFVELSATRFPELFPCEFHKSGFTLHQIRHSSKLDLLLRRIKVKSTGQILQIRPSFAMPYMTGQTEFVSKALYLRLWGVSFDALAYVFGRDAKYWERQWIALGRPSLVGSSIKRPEKLPMHIVADEKHTRLGGKTVYAPTTVAAGCIIGVTVTESASEEALTEAYGEFAQEARALDPSYSPESICLDGWSATQNAWKRLFPSITIVLCFLHSVLKVADSCLKRFGSLRKEVLDRAWNVYKATNKGEFSQRIRRFREWTQQSIKVGKLKAAILKLCNKRDQFSKSFDHPNAKRTSNMVDRLMNYQDRLLYAQRYFHGKIETARLGLRAQAILWNFHNYGERQRRKKECGISPFEDLNGFVYSENWLENFLIASSRGGKQM